MRICLSDHFTYSKLLRFVFPSVLMFVVLSVYNIIDGFFVANFVGKTEFAALNLVFPLIMGLGAIGLMLGTGGNALIAKTFGEGDKIKANKIFSMLVYITILFGILLSITGYLLIKPVISFFNPTEALFQNAITYGNIVFLALTSFLLQNEFQSLYVTAEKPKLGFYSILTAGITNIILDYIFMVPLNLGLRGAALGTAMSMFVGGLIPLLYFSRKNDSLLKLGKPCFCLKSLFQISINGSSELMTQLSGSVVACLYNYQFLKYIGVDGVAAFGIINYVCFIFYAICLGFATGGAPLFAYNYGAENHNELKNLLIKSLKIILLLGLGLFLISEIFAVPLVKLFANNDLSFLDFTVNGYRIFAVSFLFCGFNVFGSAFFTALNNGLISAMISGLRTLVFEVGALLLLPIFFGVNGVWSAIIVSEILALIVTIGCILGLKKKYRYL